MTLGLVSFLLVWLIFTTITLVSASSQPVDAFFVLGGSIRREMYVAKLAKQSPDIPILISQGSENPCVWLIFQREKAEFKKVWLEHCANSTFENFYYSLPTLKSWGVKNVKLITSGSHVLRAKLMAKVLLGAHGIWVNVDVVQEKGVPGNQEFLLKTVLDVTRSILWSILSHIIYPQCDNVKNLADVNMQAWKVKGFRCEHQAGLKTSNFRF